MGFTLSDSDWQLLTGTGEPTASPDEAATGRIVDYLSYIFVSEEAFAEHIARLQDYYQDHGYRPAVETFPIERRGELLSAGLQVLPCEDLCILALCEVSLRSLAAEVDTQPLGSAWLPYLRVRDEELAERGDQPSDEALRRIRKDAFERVFPGDMLLESCE